MSNSPTIESVCDFALGSQKTEAKILDFAHSAGLEIPDDDVAEFLLNNDIEQCWECETWCEVSELSGEDGTISCSSCGNNPKENE